jgi:hypothetical protein
MVLGVILSVFARVGSVNWSPRTNVSGLKPEGAFLTPIRQSQPKKVGKSPQGA